MLKTYLALISVLPISRWRPRGSELYHYATYCYRVKRVKRGGGNEEVNVCKNTFIAIHEKTRYKLQHIQKSLKNLGAAPIDGANTL